MATPYPRNHKIYDLAKDINPESKHNLFAANLLLLLLRDNPQLLSQTDDAGNLLCNYISPLFPDIIKSVTPQWDLQLHHLFENSRSSTIMSLKYVHGNIWQLLPNELIFQIIAYLEIQPKHIILSTV